MSTRFQNYIGGVLSGSTLAIGGTSMTSPGLAALMTIAAPDTVWIALDADASAGAQELVQVTAHTAGATTATIVRGQQGTTARSHVVGTDWALVATSADWDELPYRKFTTKGDLVVASGAGVATRLAAGTDSLPLVANSGATNGVNYAQLGTAGIADSAVTSVKIADGTIATGDLADGAVTSAKIADLTIATGDIADSAVTSAKIADLTIVTGDLADSSVTSAKIVDGTIVAGDLASSVTDLFTPGSWTALTLAGSWSNFGGGYNVAQYRKVGDMVYVRGTVTHTGGTGTTMFTMPAGARPPAIIEVICKASTGTGYLNINTAGTALYTNSADGATSPAVSFLFSFSTSS